MHALSAAHYVLCDCGQLPTYKRNNPTAISVRKIAKSCGSVVGEITSLDQFIEIAKKIGLNAKIFEYESIELFKELLEKAFKENSVAILFIQYDGVGQPALPGSQQSWHQYYEHAVVAVGWGESSEQDKPSLKLINYDSIKTWDLQDTYSSTSMVSKQRTHEFF